MGLTITNTPGISPMKQIIANIRQDYGLRITAGILTDTIFIPRGDEAYTRVN